MNFACLPLLDVSVSLVFHLFRVVVAADSVVSLVVVIITTAAVAAANTTIFWLPRMYFTF